MDRHGGLTLLMAALTLLLAFIVQSVVIGYWAGGINKQVEILIDLTHKQDKLITTLMSSMENTSNRLTRVQTVQETVVKVLEKLTDGRDIAR